MNTTKYLVWLFTLQTLIMVGLVLNIGINTVVMEFNYTKQDIIYSSIIMFLMILICVLSGCLVIYASKVIKSD